MTRMSVFLSSNSVVRVLLGLGIKHYLDKVGESLWSWLKETNTGCQWEVRCEQQPPVSKSKALLTHPSTQTSSASRGACQENVTSSCVKTFGQQKLSLLAMLVVWLQGRQGLGSVGPPVWSKQTNISTIG